MEVISSVVLVVSVVLLFGYLIQSIAAFVQAANHRLVQKVFSPQHFLDTWGVVAMIFFIPFVVSITASLIELMNSPLAGLSATLVVSMLLIFITLEFSQLGSLNDSNRIWNKLLLVAISLDVSSIILITAVKVQGVEALAFVFSIAIFAFLSSFMIILFSYVSGKSYE
ncbi:MAG: hypothetical protein JAY97_08845 [Candidatus Thiodiazotropha sp. 'RUGA']|nr:hypothetical protein [Candidatus Thiodiazotropha sp. 'RUGA']